MNTYADKASPNKTHGNHQPYAAATPASVFPFVDNRPEAVFQRKLQDIIKNGPRAQAKSDKPVQRAERKGTVTWATTHLVRVQGKGEKATLFGQDDDWLSGEVSREEFGELSKGQYIIVDDSQVFMSRRGGNQEDRAKRNKDHDDDELKYKWLKVLAVGVDGGLKPVADNIYVRAETIELDKPPRKKIDPREHSPKDEETVSRELAEIHKAWVNVSTKRRYSMGHVKEEFEGTTEEGDDITSGWNWGELHEGREVSKNMATPKERTGFEQSENGTKLIDQKTFSARYDDDKDPVAYMVLEKRQDGTTPPYVYIRWLIAHPEKGGGASQLIRQAFTYFKAQHDCTELRVESAYSAVKWYIDMGFSKVYPDKDVVKKGVGYADTELVYTDKGA